MRTAIIDYDMGNTKSVSNALLNLEVDHVLTRDTNVIKNAGALILPGVGAFGDGIKHLREFGLYDLLKDEVQERKKPFLGICIGMQLMADGGDEFGSCEGLGLISGWVRRLDPEDKKCKIPHIGWNNIEIKTQLPLYRGIEGEPDYYFVHSYAFEAENSEDVSARCEYGSYFVASIQRQNAMGVQFHPEKSQKKGMALLQNFIEFAKSC